MVIKSETIEVWFKKLLPSPFSIAILLTALTFCLTLIFGQFKSDDAVVISAFKAWKTGLWNPGVNAFSCSNDAYAGFRTCYGVKSYSNKGNKCDVV